MEFIKLGSKVRIQGNNATFYGMTGVVQELNNGRAGVRLSVKMDGKQQDIIYTVLVRHLQIIR